MTSDNKTKPLGKALAKIRKIDGELYLCEKITPELIAKHIKFRR